MGEIKIRLAHSTEIPEGKSRTFTLPDGEEVAVFHADDAYYAIQGSCPHQGGPLGEGEVENLCVSCPWHGWKFDLKSGTCLTGGDDCKVFNVEEDAGVLYLRISNPDQE